MWEAAHSRLQGNIAGPGVTGMLFATYLMFVHNPVGLWEITVEQSSPVTMLHIVIIRKNPSFPVNRMSSVHPPTHKPFQSKPSQAGNTGCLPLDALFHCPSGTCKPRLEKRKRADNVTPQISSFTDRIFSMGMLSSSLLLLLQLCKVFHCIRGKYTGSKFVGSIWCLCFVSLLLL